MPNDCTLNVEKFERHNEKHVLYLIRALTRLML